MATFESWVVSVFARHLVALKTARLNTDSISFTVKLSGMITVGFPVFIVLWTAFALASLTFASETIRVPFVLATLASVFGVSAVTDRIYDRNADYIRQLADEIKQNQNQGIWWARRRLLRIHVVYIMIIIFMTMLVKSFA